ncbi:Extracellular membrane protein, CFEM domain protein [Cordyceps fumosorosea ARSEF 2679]|uniref:Extracellular membrane protein, CFEM domain protein n=1 Tax=Cordyceps fumosorosea (strain ARSEF 2679) TaxID=1081104 RepID=A0A167R0R0_CORFA|nr:Extracellular membrane protein, CFEM domain protein [Cordyceps fumosorosea ARSEF 2679]OAA58165.1 Extracellular membrane protein, CFEM domain protein [Cordyceps fumosorosea ARSEF 2679]
MRILLLIAALIAAVIADGLNLTAITAEVPQCALQCAVAGPGQAGCGLLDSECICARLPEISALGAPCMVKAGCKIDDIMKTGSIIVGECEKAYASKHNGSIEGMYALPANESSTRTGAAARLYGAGWAVISAASFTATALWL